MPLSLGLNHTLPLPRQILDRLRILCATHALRPGSPLPSIRTLASRLKVNPNTISRIYEQLAVEGFVRRRHGSGCFVAPRRPDCAERLQVCAAAEYRALLADASALATRSRFLAMNVEQLVQTVRDAYAALPSAPQLPVCPLDPALVGSNEPPALPPLS